MIKIFTSLGLFLLGLLAQAQTTQTRTVSRFSAIEVNGNIELIYTETVAPSIKVAVSGTQKTSDVHTEIKGGVLKINSRKMNNEMQKVYVTGNGLSSVKASGAKMTVKNQLSAPELDLVLNANAAFVGNAKPAKKMTLHIEGGSTFVGRVETRTFDASISGNAKVCVTGNAGSTKITADNQSICLAGNFESPIIKANAHENATLKIHAQHAIDLYVSEKARITYTGKPSTVKMNEDAIAINSLQNAIEAVATN